MKQSFMQEWLTNGVLIDAILALVFLEAIALFVLYGKTKRGIAPADILPMLLAGAFLLLALRAVIAGAAWPVVCGCLAAAGIAHVIDTSRRWR